MPAFQGLVSEDNLVALVEYVKTLSPTATTTPAPAAPAGAAPPPNPPAAGEKK
jgi:hypothetical protein